MTSIITKTKAQEIYLDVLVT